MKVSGGHRAPEAIQLLKEFYNGENPYAPNPKVKGVKLKKEQVNGESCSSWNLEQTFSKDCSVIRTCCRVSNNVLFLFIHYLTIDFLFFLKWSFKIDLKNIFRTFRRLSTCANLSNRCFNKIYNFNNRMQITYHWWSSLPSFNNWTIVPAFFYFIIFTFAWSVIFQID